MKIVYKITYPNGKIYVGKDLTNNINYFGSASRLLISEDFTDAERQSFGVVREVLWQSVEASDREVHEVELRYIRELCSNNPSIGYNRRPKWKPT